MKEEKREQSRFMCAEDTERELLVGRTKAYQIIQTLNKELDKNGYSVQRGRVPKHYFMERFGLEKRG